MCCGFFFFFVVRSRIARDFHNRRRRPPKWSYCSANGFWFCGRFWLCVVVFVFISALLSTCAKHLISSQSLLVGLVTEILYQMFGITVSLERGVMRTGDMFFCGRSSAGTVCVAKTHDGHNLRSVSGGVAAVWFCCEVENCAWSQNWTEALLQIHVVANGRRFCRSSWSVWRCFIMIIRINMNVVGMRKQSCVLSLRRGVFFFCYLCKHTSVGRFWWWRCPLSEVTCKSAIEFLQKQCAQEDKRSTHVVSDVGSVVRVCVPTN